MKKKYLMECNHVVSVNNLFLDTIICKRCRCKKIKKILTSNTDCLEGRKAKSRLDGRFVKSRWDLPKFIYRPNKDYDLYF